MFAALDPARALVREALQRFPKGLQITLPQLAMVMVSMCYQHQSLTLNGLCRILAPGRPCNIYSVLRGLIENEWRIKMFKVDEKNFAFQIPNFALWPPLQPPPKIEPVSHLAFPLVPYSQAPMRVVIVRDAEESTRVIQECISGAKFVGVDCEWFPDYVPNSISKVALVQLCVDKYCVLLHLSQMKSTPHALVEMLANPAVLKVGVGFTGDAAKLALSLEGFKEDEGVQGAFDMSWVYERISLKGLCEQLTGGVLTLNKSKRVTISNWEQLHLTLAQIQYAAMDAFASYETFRLHCAKEGYANREQEYAKLNQSLREKKLVQAARAKREKSRERKKSGQRKKSKPKSKGAPTPTAAAAATSKTGAGALGGGAAKATKKTKKSPKRKSSLGSAATTATTNASDSGAPAPSQAGANSSKKEKSKKRKRSSQGSATASNGSASQNDLEPKQSQKRKRAPSTDAAPKRSKPNATATAAPSPSGAPKQPVAAAPVVQGAPQSAQVNKKAALSGEATSTRKPKRKKNSEQTRG
eukprot:c18399_g1_i2.p1 GENE.c18399_g1_i2~~c18399_g1_i2.p1  ORF type:complete len:527 (+),score=127.97 c18399_g1_i2:30-1610(+)